MDEKNNPYLKNYGILVERYENRKPQTSDPGRYAVVFRIQAGYCGSVVTTNTLAELGEVIADNYRQHIDDEIPQPEQVLGPWDLKTGRKLDINHKITFSLDGKDLED